MPGIGSSTTRAIGRLVVVIAEPHTRHHLGNVANKPEVASFVRGARLTSNRSIKLSRTTSTISHNAPQHPGHDCSTFFVKRPLTLKFLLVNYLTAPVKNSVNAVGFGVNSFGC
jgi:hypothetical protein